MSEVKQESAEEVSELWPKYLNDRVLSTLRSTFKFEKMTPVQSVVIPIFAVKHKDVVVEAVTGSGKTLAFVVPIFEILLKRDEALKKHDVGALIISPTRELAVQIFEVVEIFTKSLEQFTSILFVGGTSTADDVKKFTENGANIIVCTAGRFEDLLNRKGQNGNLAFHLKSLEVLILDEADRLLDLGFRESLNAIFQYLPKQRRTGLFSATQTDEIDKLIKAGLRNPCQIQVKQKGEAAKQKTPITLNNYYMSVQPEQKFHELLKFLRRHKNQKHLVFMSTCACVQYFSKILKLFMKNVEVLAMHRKLKDRRNKVFADFKKLKKGILVCTDVLSRGIDVADVDSVIQYDLPSNASAFVHRCGRTARLERIGNALVFLLPNEDSYVNFIKINQNVPLQPFVPDSTAKDTETADEVIKKIQTAASKERELYEKGKEAFVSYIRAYSKHECSYLLRVKEIDFAKLALGFGLLHLPKMPEIKKSVQFSNFPVDFFQIPYKDKHREAQRQVALENGDFNKKKKKPGSVKTVSWSEKVEKKLKRKIKREKKDIVEKKRRHEVDDDDLNELEDDFKLLKKLKRKKITEKEFEDQFMPTDDESAGEEPTIKT